MRRILATVLAATAVTLPSALVAQDPATAAGTPRFRAGQWAATFGMSDNFYGIGALRFSTPSAAWSVGGSLRATHSSQDPGDYSSDYFSTGLSLGRRWFRPGAGRVRPYSELGVTGSYSWGGSDGGGYTSKWQGYGGGIYGQLGAQIFFAPELSLGASWSGTLTYNHSHNESTGGAYPSYSSSRSDLQAEGGRIQLAGTLYF